MTWKRSRAEEARLVAAMGERPEELLPAQVWVNERQGLRALLGREYCGGRTTDPLRWHISVAGTLAPPNWDQMTEAAHAIRPGVHFVIMVPPRSWWMNVHPHVLHLWETADQALVEEARANAMQAKGAGV